MLLVGAAFFSFWYFTSLYMQNVLGFSALRAGLAFVPMAVAVIVGAQLSSRLLPRTGVRPLLVAGTIIASGGLAWLAQIQPHSTYWADVFGPGVMVSFALGVLFTPLAAAATAGVAPTEAGLASGVLNTSRQMGGSLGLAILATIATARTTAILHSGSGATTAAALTSGYSRAFLVASLLAAAALLCTYIVPRPGAQRDSPADDAHEAQPVVDPA
jgi:hypothetical protein